MCEPGCWREFGYRYSSSGIRVSFASEFATVPNVPVVEYSVSNLPALKLPALKLPG